MVACRNQNKSYWVASKNGDCPQSSLRRQVMMQIALARYTSPEVRNAQLKLYAEKGGRIDMDIVRQDPILSKGPIVDNFLIGYGSNDLIDTIFAIGYKLTKLDLDYLSDVRSGKLLTSAPIVNSVRHLSSPAELAIMDETEKRAVQLAMQKEAEQRERLRIEQEQIKAQFERNLAEQERLRKQREQELKQREQELNFMRKNYGAQVCKGGVVSYQTAYRNMVENSVSQQRGQAAAVIESVSSDGMRIQIRINGVGLEKPVSFINAAMDGMSLEQGRVYWDSIEKWSLCN